MNRASHSGRGFFEVVVEEMRLRNYSHKTIKAYVSCLRTFVRHFAPRHPRELRSGDIRSFLFAFDTGAESHGVDGESILQRLAFLVCGSFTGSPL